MAPARKKKPPPIKPGPSRGAGRVRLMVGLRGGVPATSSPELRNMAPKSQPQTPSQSVCHGSSAEPEIPIICRWWGLPPVVPGGTASRYRLILAHQRAASRQIAISVATVTKKIAVPRWPGRLSSRLPGPNRTICRRPVEEVPSWRTLLRRGWNTVPETHDPPWDAPVSNCESAYRHQYGRSALHELGSWLRRRLPWTRLIGAVGSLAGLGDAVHGRRSGGFGGRACRFHWAKQLSLMPIAKAGSRPRDRKTMEGVATVEGVRPS